MSLATNVSDLATSIATALKGTRTLLNGNAVDNGALTTTAKGNLVAAINEVKTIADAAAGGGVSINDAATNTTQAWSSQKIRDEIDAVEVDLTDLIDDVTPSDSKVYSSNKTDGQIALAVANLVDSAPGTLDTLSEIATAIGDTDTALDGLITTVGTKAPLESPTFTGTPAAPTATAGTNTTQLATTQFVTTAVSAVTIADASETVKGKVELATNAEVLTGTDTVRAITPAGFRNAVGDTATDFAATFEAGLA